MKLGEVYKITTTGCDLVYIGATTRGVKQRFSEHLHYLRHKKHFSKLMQQAFDKYGEASFSLTVLESGVHHEDINDVEQKYINQNLGKLFNSTDIADPIYSARRIMQITNAHQSPETRKKRSDSLRYSYEKGLCKKRLWDDEAREKHSRALTGRKMPPVSNETRKKISDAKLGCECSKKAVENSVKTRTAFISEEVETWVDMRNKGISFREIERITGRSRRVVSREVERFLNVE